MGDYIKLERAKKDKYEVGDYIQLHENEIIGYIADIDYNGDYLVLVNKHYYEENDLIRVTYKAIAFGIRFYDSDGYIPNDVYVVELPSRGNTYPISGIQNEINPRFIVNLAGLKRNRSHVHRYYDMDSKCNILYSLDFSALKFEALKMIQSITLTILNDLNDSMKRIEKTEIKDLQ